MANIEGVLSQIMQLNGALGACIVDSNSGMMLGSTGHRGVASGGVDMEVAAAGNTEVVRAKRKTIASLELNDQIEDILITLGKQYHLIRPMAAREGLFVYLVLDRERANLALGRHRLAEIEAGLIL